MKCPALQRAQLAAIGEGDWIVENAGPLTTIALSIADDGSAHAVYDGSKPKQQGTRGMDDLVQHFKTNILEVDITTISRLGRVHHCVGNRGSTGARLLQ